MKRKFRFCFIVFIVLIFFNGCSIVARPSEKEVKQEIEKLLADDRGSLSLYSKLSECRQGTSLFARVTKVNSVNVIERGTYNKQAKYYPIRVRVIGECTFERPGIAEGTNSFNDVLNFIFQKDDYGNWEIDIE